MTCKMKETCNAPLCPENPKTFGKRWTPAKPICKSVKYRKLSWVARQREILADTKRSYTIDDLTSKQKTPAKTNN